jgi:hypothetical protein
LPPHSVQRDQPLPLHLVHLLVPAFLLPLTKRSRPVPEQDRQYFLPLMHPSQMRRPQPLQSSQSLGNFPSPRQIMHGMTLPPLHDGQGSGGAHRGQGCPPCPKQAAHRVFMRPFPPHTGQGIFFLPMQQGQSIFPLVQILHGSVAFEVSHSTLPRPPQLGQSSLPFVSQSGQSSFFCPKQRLHMTS